MRVLPSTRIGTLRPSDGDEDGDGDADDAAAEHADAIRQQLRSV